MTEWCGCTYACAAEHTPEPIKCRADPRNHLSPRDQALEDAAQIAIAMWKADKRVVGAECLMECAMKIRGLKQGERGAAKESPK